MLQPTGSDLELAKDWLQEMEEDFVQHASSVFYVARDRLEIFTTRSSSECESDLLNTRRFCSFYSVNFAM